MTARWVAIAMAFAAAFAALWMLRSFERLEIESCANYLETYGVAEGEAVAACTEAVRS